MTERLKLTAVVLRTVDYGESDRVVTLLSRERGKLSAFARGARASRRRFGGALEPFTLVAAELSARRSGELLGLESAAVTRAFQAIRGDLARIACAAYEVELARELVRDHEPHEALFDMLVAALGRLDEAPASPEGLRGFELGALEAAGFRPRLDACARCGAPVAGVRGARLDPGEGGVLCEGCGTLAGPGVPAVGPVALEALRRWQVEGVRATAAPAPAAREARDALARFVEHLVGHRLQARRFLDEVGSILGE